MPVVSITRRSGDQNRPSRPDGIVTVAAAATAANQICTVRWQTDQEIIEIPTVHWQNRQEKDEKDVDDRTIHCLVTVSEIRPPMGLGPRQDSAEHPIDRLLGRLWKHWISLCGWDWMILKGIDWWHGAIKAVDWWGPAGSDCLLNDCLAACALLLPSTQVVALTGAACMQHGSWNFVTPCLMMHRIRCT